MANEEEAITLPRTEDLAFWLFWLGLVIILLSWDLWKAWKRGAPWIPGQALGLSAIIIQLLSFIDYSHISIYSGSRYQTKKVVATLVKNQLVIDSGRVMMCVLIAYMLPGMARSGSIMVGSNLAALALGIAFHAFSEVQSFWSEGSDPIIYYVWSAMLIPAIICLLVLLIKAVMSGRTICRIGSQQIRSVLQAYGTQGDRQDYNGIKDHVLNCWIAVRFSQPDYVLVRTGVCSTAFPFVTFCIVVHGIQWICIHFTDNESLNSGTKSTLVQFVIAGHYVIVAIGWIVLLVRWVHYRQGHTSRRSYLSSMIIEDAWIDLSAFFGRLSEKFRSISPDWLTSLKGWLLRTWKKFPSINSPDWLTSLKCWLLRTWEKFPSINSPDWLTSLKTTVIEKVKPREVPVDSQYEETVSKILLPDESAPFLWGANQRGFQNVERYMDIPKKTVGAVPQEDGESSPPQLIGLLRLQTVTEQGRKAEKRLKQLNEKSWKRTAVSLIHFMIEFYDGHQDHRDIIEKAMQCYIQALEYMNFVDGLNEEVKSLGRQADKEFKSLQHSWHQRKQQAMPVAKTTEDINLFLQRPLLPQSDCLFETWTLIKGYFSGSQQNNVGRLQGVLANVYFFNMTKGLNKAVIRKCSKLAEKGMEEEILDVAILSAKAQGVLKQVGQGNDQAELPNSRLHTAIQVDDSTDDSIPPSTENRLAGKGQGPAEPPPIDLVQSSYAAVGEGKPRRRNQTTLLDEAEVQAEEQYNRRIKEKEKLKEKGKEKL